MTLNRGAVTPELFDLLQELMREESLHAFALGAAPRSHFGLGIASRWTSTSSNSPFDARALAEVLKHSYRMTEAETSENSVSGVIAGIKIDLIAHRYPLLAGTAETEGIRMLSLEDVAAMKLNAIANRGSKKDFWDFAELLEHFSRDEMLEFYSAKYPDDSLWNVGRSLCYFDDAEGQPDPRDLRGREWTEVKHTIGRHNRL